MQYRYAKFIATRYLQSAGERNVSTTETQLYSSPCLFKRHSVSQALFSAWFVVSPGFACWCYADLRSFWPLALEQQAQAAIVFVVLRSLGGAVLFRSSCPSPNSGYPFWLPALSAQSSFSKALRCHSGLSWPSECPTADPRVITDNHRPGFWISPLE